MMSIAGCIKSLMTMLQFLNDWTTESLEGPNMSIDMDVRTKVRRVLARCLSSDLRLSERPGVLPWQG